MAGGVATASAVSLLRIPNLPNCRAIFWPLASASTRLQCAEAYAEQGNVDGLLAAIALVEQLPEDHPLRSDINSRVEEWAEQILTIAENTFQSGDLGGATAIARRIPSHTSAAGLVRDRVEAWEALWDEATDLFDQARAHIEATEFRQAFEVAIRLQVLDNRHWRTTKYEELVTLITQGRQDLEHIGQARTLIDRGTLSALTDALTRLQTIGPDRPLYHQAQPLLRQAGEALLDLAEAALGRGQPQEAEAILAQIPEQAGLGAHLRDFRTLVMAYELAGQGSAVGYSAAVGQLQNIGRDRPLYNRAQALITQWQRQGVGLVQLEQAQQMAVAGTPAALRNAIAEARRLGTDHPQWPEAQRQIDQWQRDLDRQEHGPYLAQARQLAATADRAGWNSAIETAQMVPRTSTLNREAQDLINSWRWELQRLDNGPLLSQARQWAAAGNLAQAIAVASQIPSGQALHREAQDLIATWRQETNDQDQLQRAYQVAQGGTVNSLVQAIDLARSVPERSSRWTEAQGVVNQWSWAILNTAEVEVGRDVARAIQVAQLVPSRTEAHGLAQQRIQEWSALLPR